MLIAIGCLCQNSGFLEMNILALIFSREENDAFCLAIGDKFTQRRRYYLAKLRIFKKKYLSSSNFAMNMKRPLYKIILLKSKK